MSEKVVILGAGLAGLSAAFHLKEDYELYEGEAEPGGLCRSIAKEGFIFDYSGHYLHFRNKYVRELVFSLLRNGLSCHDRKAWVSKNGRLIKYPYQAHQHPSNFKEWLFEKFGTKAAEGFLIPYNKKFWRYPLEGLTTDWADRFIPTPKYPKNIGYNAQFFYPRHGGISTLVRAIQSKIPNLHLNYEASHIDLKGRLVRFRNGSEVRYDKLISTVPLPELGEMVGKDWKGLNWTSLLILNLGIKGRVMPRVHWIYYPQRRVHFFRIGFASNIARQLAPEGTTSIYIETAHRRAAPGIDGLISEFLETGIVRSRRDISCILPLKIKYGYVVYDRRREALTKNIFDFLRRYDVYPIGRYGRWAYMSMEDAILDGKRIAEGIGGEKRGQSHFFKGTA